MWLVAVPHEVWLLQRFAPIMAHRQTSRNREATQSEQTVDIRLEAHGTRATSRISFASEDQSTLSHDGIGMGSLLPLLR